MLFENMTDWKSKLEAFLHDSPSKSLNIPEHWIRAMNALRQAGSTDAKIDGSSKKADHIAAAADRIPFPHPRAGAKCGFDGIENSFLHPLSGEKLILENTPKFEDNYYALESSVQPVLNFDNLTEFENESDKWRACFFAHWRLWSGYASERIPQFAFLPADTRIPDHTIWNHVQIVSALRTTAGNGDELKPAFLRFQIGPVQDFIAAARSTRDLWSGSYLLSWLMVAGLKKLSEQVGPDSVVFPNLKGQPLFDLHWSQDIWSKINIGRDSLWKDIQRQWKDEDLLTPNLPNVFLALIPEERADELGHMVEDAINKEWQSIAESVWEFCSEAGLTNLEKGIPQEIAKDRFFRQTKQFLSISWNCTPWPTSLDEAVKTAERFKKKNSEKADQLPILTALDRVQNVIKFATEIIPESHRDERFYLDKDKRTKLSNVGLAWSILVALNQWELDAVRQTRNFVAMNSGGWAVGVFNNKDSLTGKEEAVAGGREWKDYCTEPLKDDSWPSLFKHADWVGASTLIKRVWHLSYLKKKWKLPTDSKNFPWPSTRDIALHQPHYQDQEKETDDTPSEEDGKYFAVLAFDGDDIGKWVSGEKTPQFKSQLAFLSQHDKEDSRGSEQGVLSYLKSLGELDEDTKNQVEGFLNSQRPLSPGYHLQFSETLTNFALHCARPIVEALNGRLIYAGGDDVVALVPADVALNCAEALKMAFRGESGLSEFLKRQVLRIRKNVKPENVQKKDFQDLAAREQLFGPNDLNPLFKQHAQGFLARLDGISEGNSPVPMALPGSKATASVGIAIAHHKAPLQDVVKQAQKAEKLAKKLPGKGAVNITVMKRSGEIIEWATWFDHKGARGQGIALCDSMQRLLTEEVVSSRFPHRIVELLSVYQAQDQDLLDADGAGMRGMPFTAEVFNSKVAKEVILKEVQVAADRQRGPNFCVERLNEFSKLVEAFLIECQDKLLQGEEGRNASSYQINAIVKLSEVVSFSARTSKKS